MSFFGISVPQASLDIAKYMELAPANLVYDRSARIYVAAAEFKPMFATSSSSRFLNELLAIESGLLEAESSFLGWRPSIALVPTPGRTLSPEILAGLLRAIRDKSSVQVLYQSMSKPEPGRRILTPHSFAHDGYRWHMRAYCHQRAQFLDFVVARLLEIEPASESGPGAQEDKSWNQMVEVVLIPHPKLSVPAQKAISLDYGMDAGEVRINCRKALLFYFLKHLGLDAEVEGEPPKQQIALRNRAEILEMLKDA
jgi:predicted DNA-binding transcriptional regulator YafY